MDNIASKINELFKDNIELQKKYEEELVRIVKEKQASSDGQAIQIALKNVADIDVSLSDIEKMYAVNQEIDDNELDRYNGGLCDAYQWCDINYCCIAIFDHPKMEDICNYGFEKDGEDQGQMCWSDYNCGIIVHNAGF